MASFKKSKRHLTKAERQARAAGWRPVLEGREDFIRDNAVSLVLERDATIARMRSEITKLTRKWQAFKRERDQLHKDLEAAQDPWPTLEPYTGHLTAKGDPDR